MSELEELLRFATEALDEVEAIVSRGRSEFAASLDRQRALAFCWIAVGSALKDYAHIAELPARQEPLSSPIRLRDRIAHQSLSPLDADVLWRVSTERVSDLQAILIVLRDGAIAPLPRQRLPAWPTRLHAQASLAVDHLRTFVQLRWGGWGSNPRPDGL